MTGKSSPQGSPRSVATDRSGSPPPQLDPSTLALLNEFMVEREDREREFAELEEAAAARLAAQYDGDQPPVTPEKMMDVPTYIRMFGEDWQLSQFWYSPEFAYKFARFVRSLITDETSTIAYLCSPTAYVGFQHTNPLPNVKLLEYDRRFGIFAGASYIPYDLDEPDQVPDSLVGKVELAIADPPFLNEVTNRKLKQTLLKILHPTKGRLILLTSTSVSSLPEIYDAAPVGPLHLTPIKVEHNGGIANDFGVWSSWKIDDYGEFAPATLGA